eukprot:m.53994 g.53994  ORF g.53994 m.53994 type:complete len:67 (+) comp11868_c0_seq1:110-310(+)
MNDLGASGLAAGLRLNASLKKIDLSMNRITSVGACALAEALRENYTLTKFLCVNVRVCEIEIGRDR